MTQSDLGLLVHADRQAITRLEQGVGSCALLCRVMSALDYHVVGLAKGLTLPDQLRNRRKTLAWTKGELAQRAGLSRATVAAVEAGSGSISSVLAISATLSTKTMARRKPQLIPLSPLNSAERDKRFTPVHFLDVIGKVWGEIDLDPAAHPESPVRARRFISLRDGGDGLTDEWSGRLVYVNPPFSEAVKWLQRADEMWVTRKVEIIVALVPVRTDGNYFHDRLSKVCDIALLRGRFHFSRGEGQQDKACRAPFPLMAVIWGASRAEIARFGELSPCVWVCCGGDYEAQTAESLSFPHFREKTLQLQKMKSK